MSYKAIVIGASAGGFFALKKLITALPSDFSIPILIVQHISPTSDSYMAKHLNKLSGLTVKEADEKEIIKPGHVYIAPPNYHILIEEDCTISLSTSEKKNYSRPSIDILFETATFAYGEELIGIVLTGANNDGSSGLLSIKNSGGYCIVQDPDEAEVDTMPLAAIKTSNPQKILTIEGIAKLLIKINNASKKQNKIKKKKKDIN